MDQRRARDRQLVVTMRATTVITGAPSSVILPRGVLAPAPAAMAPCALTLRERWGVGARCRVVEGVPKAAFLPLLTLPLAWHIVRPAPYPVVALTR
jgi:hypothetical protein